MKFRGQNVKIVEGYKGIKNPMKFYYGMRHTDDDWGVPITVEPKVLVNRWGIMITEKRLRFRSKEDPHLILTKKEINRILKEVQGCYIHCTRA